MKPHYDLIIVGGGMAGASLAIALSGLGLKLAVVEAALPAVGSVPNYDDRAIALAWGSSRIFTGLGVWQDISARAEPIREIHVSERGGFGFTRLHHAREGVAALGYAVTARDLGSVLLASLANCEDVELIAPARVTSVHTTVQQASIGILRDGEPANLDASLLVAADGGHSFIREQLQVATRHWDYGQHAIIANISPSKPHQGVAFERFTEQGPIALLPMSERRCALVYTVEDQELEAVQALDDQQFLARVQQRFGWRLGRFAQVGKRTAYPLSHIRALECVHQRVAFVGNAAHTLHPIAGQGFNLGLRDVAALAEVVLDAHQNGLDMGSEQVLQHYDRWRSADQQAVAIATDSLVRLFTNPLRPVKLARNLGMLTLDALPMASHRLARAAMGIHGRLPKLARGFGLD
jgi:2-octaprenyl-6-methoxyphenol hydroxylase